MVGFIACYVVHFIGPIFTKVKLKLSRRLLALKNLKQPCILFLLQNFCTKSLDLNDVYCNNCLSVCKYLSVLAKNYWSYTENFLQDFEAAISCKLCTSIQPPISSSVTNYRKRMTLKVKKINLLCNKLFFNKS